MLLHLEPTELALVWKCICDVYDKEKQGLSANDGVCSVVTKL